LIAGIWAFWTLAAPVAANATPMSSASLTSNHQSDFSEFWLDFRRALLSADATTLERMTRFPLKVRGELDSDPVRHVARRELQIIFDRVLTADSGTSARERISNRLLVERTESLVGTVRGVAVSADTARVGPFSFRRGSNGWQLEQIYLGGD
jgi:hypothetical protein